MGLSPGQSQWQQQRQRAQQQMREQQQRLEEQRHRRQRRRQQEEMQRQQERLRAQMEWTRKQQQRWADWQRQVGRPQKKQPGQLRPDPSQPLPPQGPVEMSLTWAEESPSCLGRLLRVVVTIVIVIGVLFVAYVVLQAIL